MARTPDRLDSGFTSGIFSGPEDAGMRGLPVICAIGVISLSWERPPPSPRRERNRRGAGDGEPRPAR